MFGKGRKVQQEMDRAKADFEKAMDSKEDSKQGKAFRAKIGLRIRSSIDKIFIDGAEKFAKFAGISSDTFDKMMRDRSYLEAIVQLRQDAVNRYEISSTPSFVVNEDKIFSGALSFDEFLSELNAFGI